jgi:PAS domain S-box-containing protein
MTLTQLEQVLAIAAIALPVMEWIRRKLVRAYRRVKQAIERIDYVYGELSPNGGGSVKDKINQLSRDVAVLRGGLSFSLTLNPHCIFEADPDGHCTFANVALCNLFGLSQEEMLGRGWLSALDGSEARERAWDTWDSCVSKHIPYLDRYQIRNARTGERIWVRAHAIPAGHPDKPLHYYGTVERELAA